MMADHVIALSKARVNNRREYPTAIYCHSVALSKELLNELIITC